MRGKDLENKQRHAAGGDRIRPVDGKIFFGRPSGENNDNAIYSRVLQWRGGEGFKKMVVASKG